MGDGLRSGSMVCLVNSSMVRPTKKPSDPTTIVRRNHSGVISPAGFARIAALAETDITRLLLQIRGDVMLMVEIVRCVIPHSQSALCGLI